jgi:hypothetical protein
VQVILGPEHWNAPLEAERVTRATGAPTLWPLLFPRVEEKRYDFSGLERILARGSTASKFDDLIFPYSCLLRAVRVS